MVHDPDNYNTDLRVDTQIRFLIILFFCQKENQDRKDVTINDIMAFIPDNMELWINLHEDTQDRQGLEKTFRKRVQDLLSGMREFKLEIKGMDGRIKSIETIEALARDPASYIWKKGKDFDIFYLYILGELGAQFDIEIAPYESNYNPYSDRCILTHNDQLLFVELYRKSGLTP